MLASREHVSANRLIVSLGETLARRLENLAWDTRRSRSEVVRVLIERATKEDLKKVGDEE